MKSCSDWSITRSSQAGRSRGKSSSISRIVGYQCWAVHSGVTVLPDTLFGSGSERSDTPEGWQIPSSETSPGWMHLFPVLLGPVSNCKMLVTVSSGERQTGLFVPRPSPVVFGWTLEGLASNHNDLSSVMIPDLLPHSPFLAGVLLPRIYSSADSTPILSVSAGTVLGSVCLLTCWYMSLLWHCPFSSELSGCCCAWQSSAEPGRLLITLGNWCGTWIPPVTTFPQCSVCLVGLLNLCWKHLILLSRLESETVLGIALEPCSPETSTLFASLVKFKLALNFTDACSTWLGFPGTTKFIRNCRAL